MRKDMKDVIVTPGRYGKYDPATKTQKTNDLDELEKLPDHEGMKKRYAEGGRGWSFGDHINPLRGFLRKNVGRSFEDVFSEFSEHCDRRSLRGWHLRDHLRMEVDNWNTRQCKLGQRWSRPREFYVDPKGILRHDPDRGWKSRPKEHDPDNCQIDGVHYKRINNCWFEVRYETRDVKMKRWNYINEEWDYYFIKKDYVDAKRQLNKKDLKRLGLSNDPDFRWWEKVA